MDDFELTENIDEFQYTATNLAVNLTSYQYLFTIRKVYDNKAYVHVITFNGSNSRYVAANSYYKIGSFETNPLGFGTVEDDGSQPDVLIDLQDGTGFILNTGSFYIDLNLLDQTTFSNFFS